MLRKLSLEIKAVAVEKGGEEAIEKAQALDGADGSSVKCQGCEDEIKPDSKVLGCCCICLDYYCSSCSAWCNNHDGDADRAICKLCHGNLYEYRNGPSYKPNLLKYWECFECTLAGV
eukprot:15217759-Ditylum_brightwellii.AAC.1